MTRNSLKNILDSVTDLDDVINTISESPYVTTTDFPDRIKIFKHNFMVLTLNIQSLHAKYNALKCFVEDLLEKNICISAICLQETWIPSGQEHLADLYSLPNYTTVYHDASISSHSGLITYLHNNFSHKILNTQIPNKIWEGQFLEISGIKLKGKLTLCNIYRPPRSTNNQIDLFLT